MFKTEPLRKVAIEEHLKSDAFFRNKGFTDEQALLLSRRFQSSQLFLNPQYRVLATPFNRPESINSLQEGVQLSIKQREGQAICPLPIATDLMRQILPGYHGFTVLGHSQAGLDSKQLHLWAFKGKPFYLTGQEKGLRPLAQTFQPLWLGEQPEKTVLRVRSTVSFRSASFVWALGYPPFSIVDFVDEDHHAFQSRACLSQVVQHLFGSSQAFYIHASTPFEEFDRQVLVVDQGMGRLCLGF